MSEFGLVNGIYPFLVADGPLKFGDNFFVVVEHEVRKFTAGPYVMEADGSCYLVASPDKHFHLFCYRSHDTAAEALRQKLRQEKSYHQERFDAAHKRLIELGREARS